MRHEESFTIVFKYPFFNWALVCYYNFFIVRLIIFPVAIAAESFFLLHVQILLELCSWQFESMLNKFVVSLTKQVQCVFISHLEELYLSHYHLVNYSQVVVDGLIEYHVVNDWVHLLRGITQTVDTVDIDVLDCFF